MKTLVLFNGGLKDTFLATLAGREGEVLLCYFILNQRDRVRLVAVSRLAQTLQMPFRVYDLVSAPPLEEVLLRMLYLMLHALPIAKERQCTCIYHGLSQDDDPRIVSVMDAYVKQLGSLVELAQPLYDGKGIWLGNVSIETPLRRLDRARVIRLGNEWAVPWEDTWSCQQNIKKHCGGCIGCQRRRRAFKREGHDDITPYDTVILLRSN